MQREKYYPHPFYWEILHGLRLKKELSNYKFLCKSHWLALSRISYNRYIRKGYYFTYEEWKQHMLSLMEKLTESECKEWKHFIESEQRKSKRELKQIDNVASPISISFIATLIAMLLDNKITKADNFVFMIIIFVVAYFLISHILFYYDLKRSYKNDFYNDLLTFSDSILQRYKSETSSNEYKCKYCNIEVDE